MDFFRKQVLLTSSPSPSVDNFVSPTEPHSARPRLLHTSTSTTGSLDNDILEAGFVIQELTKEPTSSMLTFIMFHCMSFIVHAYSTIGVQSLILY